MSEAVTLTESGHERPAHGSRGFSGFVRVSARLRILATTPGDLWNEIISAAKYTP